MKHKNTGINTTAFMGDAHINLTQEQRKELNESVATKSPLYAALLELVYSSAEYSHPCDADELRLDKATGHVTIQELREVLAKHEND